jgi:hypothetical protein
MKGSGVGSIPLTYGSGSMAYKYVYPVSSDPDCAILNMRLVL